jgi:hypothetical protein
MLQMRTWMIDNSRTANKSSLWRATVFVSGELSAPNGDFRGELITAVSRNGAPNELARTLLEHGIPDQPVEILDEDFARTFPQYPALRYPSLREMAAWTFEGEVKRRWRDRPSPFSGGGAKNAPDDG